MYKPSSTGTTVNSGSSRSSTSLPPNVIRLQSGRKVDISEQKHIGLLCKVIFSGHNDFIIAKFDDVTGLGKISDPVVGASYQLKGKWEENKKRVGEWQFVFTEYEAKVDTERGLVQYLAREAPGLGPKLSASLVALHGFRVMELLRSDDESINGVGPGIRKALRDWAKREHSNSTIKEKLYSIGLGTAQVAKLVSHYGGYAEDKIRKDCFSLTEIKGFGFKTVSAIADLIGIPTNDKGRIKAAVLHAADSLMEEGGHVCLTVRDVVEEACALLALKMDVVVEVVRELVEEEEFLIAETCSFKKYIVDRGIVLG